MKTIWIYTKNNSKLEAATYAAEKCDAKIMNLSPDDLGKTIGDIVGINLSNIPLKKPKVPAVFEMPEMMLMNGLADEDLDMFLASYKEKGVPSIPLKAVVTPINATWFLYDLISAVTKEHKVMQKKNETRKINRNNRKKKKKKKR